MFGYGETVTVQTAGPNPDAYSDTTTYDDWDNPTNVDVEDVAVADGGSTEPLEVASDAVDSDFDLYFPADATVTAENRVVVRGLVCDVAGRPFLWRNPFTGWTPGLVVKVKIREG